MIKNRDQIDEAGREFYWKRNPHERAIVAESTRPDMLIGYREGYEQALRDVKEALQPKEPVSSPMKNKSAWQTIKEREEEKERYNKSLRVLNEQKEERELIKKILKKEYLTCVKSNLN